MLTKAHEARAKAEQQAAEYKLQLKELQAITVQLQAALQEAGERHSALLEAFKHERKMADKQHRSALQTVQAQHAAVVSCPPRAAWFEAA
jgi:hypothetical protein